MFCPQYLVRYRPGFTHCSDCDVGLVPELPLASSDSFEANPSGWPGEEGDPFCAFWHGDDAPLHAELCTVLDEAGIPHKTARREEYLFNLKNSPALQIGVLFSLFERAETAVKHAYETATPGVDDLPSPKEPARSGEDTALRRLLIASLRENKIHVHRETSLGQQSLLVSSEQQAKAREIVKEVVEGVPPE